MTLFLFPNSIGILNQNCFPPNVAEAVTQIDGLIAESAGGGRSFLNQFRTKKPPHQIPVAVFNEKDIDFFLKPIKEGQNWGFVSDSGLPCIADPGSKLVYRARQLGIPIETFVGPSSILMALILSGLPGQRFFFHGYLAKDPLKLKKELKQLEQLSKEHQATQLFIEAPYRNKHTLQAMCDTLHDDTHICVAWDLTLPTQGVLCKKNSSLKKSPLPQIEKKPTIFLLYS